MILHSYFRRRINKIRNLIRLRLGYKISKLSNLEKLGSDYGGWVIPKDYLTENSVCYLAGAGEDISFDVCLAEKYQSNIFIFDPTPRAKKHFDELVDNINSEKKIQIPGSKNKFYNISRENLVYLKFYETGLWNDDTEIKFYSPVNKEFVSHSALNLFKTEDYFIAKVKRLSTILNELGHSKIDLLKLDIEGAEYKVLDSIIEDNIYISILCIEFDEIHNPLDNNYLNRITQSLDKLLQYNYVLVDMDRLYNTTLIKKEIYKKISADKI